MMTLKSLEKELVDLDNGVEAGKINPDKAIDKVHALDKPVFKKFGMSLDNDLCRNGVLCPKLAKKINPQLVPKHNWYEVYSNWTSKVDSVRPLDKFSAHIPLNQMILSIEIGDYKEQEQDYDMEKCGNKYANLADC